SGRAQAPPFNDIVSRSGVIFIGTLKAIGEATPTMVRSPNSAIVTVDRVIDAEPQVGHLAGKDVTVRLRNPRIMRVGSRAVFYTYVQAAGASLGLVEVASEPVGQQASVESRVKDARQAIADQALARR